MSIFIDIKNRSDVPEDVKVMVEQYAINQLVVKEILQKYRVIFDQSPIAVEFYDAVGGLVTVNDACLDLFGVENVNEVVGFKLFEDPNIPSEMKEKLKNKESVKFEANFSFDEVKRLNLYKTTCSGIKTLSWYINPIRDGGFVTGYIMQIQDITECKRLEEELLFKNTVLQTVQESSIDGLLVVDKNHQIVLFNQRFSKMWNIPDLIIESRSDEQTLLSVLDNLVDPEKFIAEVNRLYESPGEKVCDEVSLRDGRTFDRYSAPVVSIGGQYLGRLWEFRDVTAYKKAEAEQLKNQKLESLGVLAGGIAHDFNNLLSGILGNLSLIEVEEDRNKREELRGEAMRAATQASLLSRKLLVFAKGGIPEVTVGSIAKVIRGACELSIGKSSGIICELKLADDLYPVKMDASQIYQVFQNLVINATQAMAENGVLKINANNVELAPNSLSGLQTGGPFTRVSVRDTGIGMSAEVMNRIFEPYFTTKGAGSGLGLAVAHAVIKNHGGAITTESVLGKGTTFCVYLPACMDAHKNENIKIVSSFQPRKLKILVMDDEKMLRNMLKMMLERFGHDTVLTKNGQEAIMEYTSAIDSNKPFDLVILDLTIPGGMGGKETLNKILEIDPSVLAVVSSGYSTDLPEGFVAGLGKPYSLKKLEETIREICIRFNLG